MPKISKYWENRAIDQAKRVDKSVNKTNKLLVDEFERAEKEINSLMHEFYLKYAIDGKITYAEAQQALSVQELKKFKSKLEEFKDIAKDSFGTFNKELNMMSYKARVTRLQALETEIKANLDILYGRIENSTEECLKNVFEQEYMHSLYDIDVYTNTLHNFSMLKAQDTKEAIDYPTSGLKFSERIWKQQIDLTQKLKSTFLNQSINGKNPYSYAKELSHIYDVKKYEAYRLLFNESAALSERASIKAYQEDGINEVQICATLDSHTSEICQDKDGKIVKLDGAVQGKDLPPFHINCRTTTVPYFGELSDGIDTRIARDEEGKPYYVSSNMTYKEWNKIRLVDAAPEKYKEKFKKVNEVLGARAPNKTEYFEKQYYKDDLFDKYVKAVESGELTPLADYGLYISINNELRTKIIGLTTIANTNITSISYHSIARTIGSVEQRRNGVKVDDIVDALTNKKSIVYPIRESKNGKSQKYRNELVEATINPDNGMLIQVNPIHRKKVNS